MLLASACKIERTPREFFDHQDPIALEREAAAEEIRDRLLALAQAVSRGDAPAAYQAFSPSLDAFALGPVDGIALRGAEQIDSVLQHLARSGTTVRLRDVQVEVGPRANMAWFAAVVELPEREEGLARTLRATGAYVRNEGGWQLVQAHLSLPAPLTAFQPSPEPGADSLGAEAPSDAPSTPPGGS